MNISVELSTAQAEALAQLCKRWRHDIARSLMMQNRLK
jgi:hypothetical protein